MKTIRLENAQIAPSGMVCIGRNHPEYIREPGNETPDDMVIYNKPNSATSARLHANIDASLNCEGEICFTVRAGRLRPLGFGLDPARRELQSILKAKGLPGERARACDGTVRFSDLVTLGDTPPESLSPGLEDDDNIMTGTPQGVGQVRAGERLVERVIAGQEELVSHGRVAE